MPGIKVEKRVESISVGVRKSNGKFYLGTYDQRKGDMRWRAAKVRNLRAAVREAKKLHIRLCAAADWDSRELPKVQVARAMEQAIDRSNFRSERHRLNLDKAADYFCTFLNETFPEVEFWHQVRASHGQAYVDALKKRDLSPKTMRHYVSIIIKTARHWNNEDERFRIFRIQHPALLPEEAPAKEYLMRNDVEHLVQLSSELCEHHARIGFLLCGLCGLNIFEVINRRRQDFDFHKFTVSITKSKNRFRTRTLPIPVFVSSAIHEFFETRTLKSEWLIPMEKDVDERTDKHGRFHPAKKSGDRAEDFKLAKCMRRVIAEARARAKDGRFDNVAPKDLRKSFMNIAECAGVEERHYIAYVGHAAGTMAQLHYVDHGNTERLRNVVVAKIFGRIQAGCPVKKKPSEPRD